MHTTVGRAVGWLEATQEGLRDRVRLGQPVPTPIVCPPFVSLVPVRGLMDNQLMRLGAQNCHWEPEGPHTGEISPTMLRGIVDYVMVGHSERRAAGETDDHIARKVTAITDAGLIPILFVGEEEPTPTAADQSEQQLRHGLSGIDLNRHEVLVVYEPPWAIGADQAADPDHVRTEAERLKGLLRRFGASDPKVIYGGTVHDENIEQFARLDILDGVGATRASLDSDRFLKMLDRIGRARARP
ncbi:MAG: triose-phosphate isomerase [Actinomycetota bacterium]|nr:triose-phosphate isomerase [Actinomycetota bacterium]